MTELIIVGASGFGRELLQYVRDAYPDESELRFRGFLDDDPEKADEVASLGAQVIGSTYDYEPQDEDRVLISLGDPKLRQTLAERLKAQGASFFTLIHPTAYVAASADIAEGCIIGPFANVGSFVSLGQHSLLNLYSAAGHDTRIGAYCVFSPYSVANGGSTIGSGVFFGTQAVVTPNVTVGKDSKLAAGAVVYKDVAAQSLAAGNPAKAYPLQQPGRPA